MRIFSETMRKNILSVLIGPLAIIPAVLLMGLVSHLLSSEESAITNWKQIFNFFSVIGVAIAYVLTTLLALPLVIVAKNAGIHFDECAAYCFRHRWLSLSSFFKQVNCIFVLWLFFSKRGDSMLEYIQVVLMQHSKPK